MRREELYLQDIVEAADQSARILDEFSSLDSTA